MPTRETKYNTKDVKELFAKLHGVPSVDVHLSIRGAEDYGQTDSSPASIEVTVKNPKREPGI